MNKTKYADVNEIIRLLLQELQKIFNEKFVALYLDGSLVIGDFDPGISDIDLVIVVQSHITDGEFEALKSMHDTFVNEHPEWYDRIEICYVTREDLNTIKSCTSQIINISPGEPIHRIKSNKNWLMNWYLTRETGMILFGPSPKDIIEPISKDEFLESVKKHAESWDKWVEQMKNPFAQSYAIFSLCRALYTIKTGEQVSKKQAALWVEKEYPKWSNIIQKALKWRFEGKYNPPDEINFPTTVAFVHFARSEILKTFI